MNHIAKEKWTLYIQNELPEHIRGEFENHLYDCDHCLHVYIDMIEKVGSDLPHIQDSANFTDNVMSEMAKTIAKTAKEDQKTRLTSFPFHQYRRKTLTHYVLAAAMTIILMSTGVFSQFMNMASTIDNLSEEARPSFIKKMIDRPISITEKLENNLQEGTKNE